MPRISKEKVTRLYEELVRQHKGKPIGEGIFKRETGLSQHYWKGGYWRSWSAFQKDAGYVPNIKTSKIPDEILLNSFAELALENGVIPTEPDLMLRKKDDPSFPNKLAFRRLGGRDQLLEKVAEYCKGKDKYAPVLNFLQDGISESLKHKIESLGVKGFVYLLRSGKKYKIGRSNAVGRRLRELSIQLPQKPNCIHVIETDDPEGIEQYWHLRFKEKREGGEWFALSQEDIRAFKKRGFQ